MNSIQQITKYNIFQLEQGEVMLKTLEDHRYTLSDPALFESGIGEHIRHILEHYLCLLEGLPSHRIDYDARRRDKRISSDKSVAIETIERVVRDLDAIPPVDEEVVIQTASTDDESESSSESVSTLKRELQYLLAHTIHHYALISFILRSQGVQPHDGFGVAPSTLRHRQESVQQA